MVRRNRTAAGEAPSIDVAVQAGVVDLPASLLEPEPAAPAAVHAEVDGRCWHPKCRGEGWPCIPAQSLGLA
jgi:hypothetical protein